VKRSKRTHIKIERARSPKEKVPTHGAFFIGSSIKEGKTKGKATSHRKMADNKKGEAQGKRKGGNEAKKTFP